MHRLRFLSVKVKPSHTVFMQCTAVKISTAKMQVSSAQIGGTPAQKKDLI